ncbi:DUF6538 domain-containing protein [Phenylobacterium sp.]|uniref:DUF6538 domain-containing protein n=1 Tax=Phenylobacterium sp. TaxID=1871053 RepID=UPI00351D4C3B
MVRGRVFYVRLRVPRSLERTVGRTHVWRSLHATSLAGRGSTGARESLARFKLGVQNEVEGSHSRRDCRTGLRQWSR